MWMLLAPACLWLTGCQLPEDAMTVRRAESAGSGTLFAGAGELNVPIRASSINDVARMLAGMEAYGGQSGFAAVRDSSAWPHHQRQMEALWRRHELGRGQKVRAWAAQEISDLQHNRALFYPFSGPDYLFAHELFPSAETYILCGLEPAEPLPDLRTLSPGDVALGLYGLRTSLSSIMDAGYFVTKDMRNDFQATRFRGTLPVLLVFLARTGATVESVDIVTLDGSGTPVLTVAAGGSAPGLMIRFRNGVGGMKRLFYFRQDLSNGSTRLGGAFLTFVAKQGYPPALVKSASYLMHDSGFSNIRSYLVRSTSGLVQDPSGVPYRDLVNAGLSVDLYGRYQGTLGIFSQQQPDLMSAYSSGGHRVQAVDFGFGYLYNSSSTSIMVARRR
ncbi:hypothetical protein [Prosthecobacter debontii]|uniref:hypothetical protein n=1 Tax=Prosthecobacter debontii TaxID=48467 RepID=UPI00158FB969|nr:hypothetical protein [Prosthecobacter debontii]